MSTSKTNGMDYQHHDEEYSRKAEDDERLKIKPGLLDEASIVKYESGLAYHTANRSFFQQANAVCEDALTQTPSNCNSEKPVQQPESKANKPGKRTGNKAGERPESSTASKEQEKPTSEPGGIVKRLSNLLSTHARLVTRLDGALDRLKTLAGSTHRGYAGMKAWIFHFDAVAELVDGLAKMEKGILEDREIKAFVGGEGRGWQLDSA